MVEVTLESLCESITASSWKNIDGLIKGMGKMCDIFRIDGDRLLQVIGTMFVVDGVSKSRSAESFRVIGDLLSYAFRQAEVSRSLCWVLD